MCHCPAFLESAGACTVLMKPGEILRCSLSISPTSSLGLHSAKIWFCSKVATSESPPPHLQKEGFAGGERRGWYPKRDLPSPSEPFWAPLGPPTTHWIKLYQNAWTTCYCAPYPASKLQTSNMPTALRGALSSHCLRFILLIKYLFCAEQG